MSTQNSFAADNQNFCPEVFVFTNGLPSSDKNKIAAQVKKLGYNGIGQIKLRNHKKIIEACQNNNLHAYSLYVPLSPVISDEIKEVIKNYKDKKITLSMPVHITEDKAINSLRKLSALTKETSIKISISPHKGMMIETVEQGLALIKKVNRDNVGISLNLCHMLANDSGAKTGQLIKKAADKLYEVSICGANEEPSNKSLNYWSNYIKVLGKGNYNVADFLKQLKQSGFKGPIGIQCYQIEGDKIDNLKENINAWNKLLKKINSTN